MAPSLYECESCRALFRQKEELRAHLNSSPSCKMISQQRRHNPNAFTAELDCLGKLKTLVVSETVPDTIVNDGGGRLTIRGHNKPQAASNNFEDDSLLAAMESGMKKSAPRKSGVEMSILSAIAEGDTELVDSYKKLPIDPSTGTKTLTSGIVSKAVSRAKVDVKRVADKFSRAQNVSLCFLIDTTGSMTPFINGVKEQIIEIVNRIHESNCGIAGLAFVGYKDWYNGENHFEVLPFTTSIAAYKSFVSGIKVEFNDDTPEDVNGGLSHALKLNWPQSSGSRILFHIGDSPPHGKNQHNCADDLYPNGHPKDRPLAQLFQEMRDKEIDYYFGKITDATDKMIEVFEQHYGRPIDTLDSSKVSTLSDDVTASVMKTVTTATSTTLSTIRMEGSISRKYRLINAEPDWSRLPAVVATVMSFNLPESIEFITSFTKMEDVVRKCNAQIAPDPFAKGGIRLAYYGRVIYNDPRSPSRSQIIDEVVFKEMISLPKVPELDRQRYMTDLEVQTVAAKLAFEFNARLGRTKEDPNMKLKFLMAKVVRFDNQEGKPPRFMAYEKRFRGPKPEMIKYTNNLDFVRNPGTLDEVGRTCLELAIAFSHFTYSITGGYLLVCDLQGVRTQDKKGKPTLLLTDPAINCSKHLRFGKTNLEAPGISRFFAKHKCNKFCAALGLKMPIINNFD